VDVLAARLAFWTVLAEHQDREWQVYGDDDPICAARAGGRVDVDNGVLGGARITVRFTAASQREHAS
jgi:hypothetical protein